MTPDPEKIVIELRPRPVPGWPWDARLRQLLKTLGRAYQCPATVIDEVFATPATEPASTPNHEAGQ